MSELINSIKRQQILSAEQMVIDNLKKKGLITDEPKDIYLEGNKIIAHYEGKVTGVGIPLDTYNRYHLEWNLIMPVLEKISKIKVDWTDATETDTYYPRTFGMLNAETGNPMVRLNVNQVFEAETLIEATWIAIVDFLKWYAERQNG